MKKPKQTHKAYLYLAKRDKRGAKLVARFQSSVELNSRITNLKSLNLPVAIEKQLEEIAYTNRMDWELWIETVDSYENLRNHLYKRGYSNISINPIPMLNEFRPVSEKGLEKPPKTMLPRGK